MLLDLFLLHFKNNLNQDKYITIYIYIYHLFEFGRYYNNNNTQKI